jgi:NADPH:quinone reductase-like Zn-dependent oxidoreductase
MPHPTMQAIVQEGHGSPDVLHLREVERPPLTDDGVLVRVHAASINAFDWSFVRLRVGLVIARLMGGKGSPIRGADLAGVVEACGSKAGRFQPGDEVFGAARGSFAQYAVTTEARLAMKPPSVSFEQAAALPVAGCTALQGMRDHARVQPGQSVLVYGAGGGTGTLAVQVARALGARVAAVTRTRHVDLLRSIGADPVIDYQREDFTLRNERYDVLFDIGANRSFADCRRVITPQGRLILVGAPKQMGALLARLAGTMIPRTGRRPALFTARIRAEDLATLGELAGSGRVRPVIDRTYPLHEIREAFRHFERGDAGGKIVIAVP